MTSDTKDYSSQYSTSRLPGYLQQFNTLSQILPSAATLLPGIVAIGVQSSGKTSVLESVTGKHIPASICMCCSKCVKLMAHVEVPFVL